MGQYAPAAPVSSVVYAPAATAQTVILAPPVQADYVVMNGKSYASMEEAMQDYCNMANAAANAPVEESAPVVESAPPPVEEAQDAAEPAAEKTVRAVKPTKKGC